MELVETLEISGEEREIADAYARGQIGASNVATVSGMSYSAEDDEINIYAKMEPNATVADRVSWHDDALNGIFDTMTAVKQKINSNIDGINSNLDTLKFGEVAGGKNIWTRAEREYTNTGTDARDFFVATVKIDGQLGGAGRFDNIGRYSIEFNIENAGTHTILLYHSGDSADLELFQLPVFFEEAGQYTISFNVNSCNPTVVNGLNISKIQIEKGIATSYEPYIPSVKMLAEENAQQNTEAMDLKMLGWTVPKECPIQNYTDSDGVFHQRVGRVDLGSLSWTSMTANRLSAMFEGYKKVANSIKPNAYTNKYSVVNRDNSTVDKSFTLYSSSDDNDGVIICDSSYTDVTAFKNAMQGVYLYYELAAEISMNVDGNEAVTKVNESLSVIGKCKNLLNPTLQTTTLNGVTCTANGDGTYTLNGTASESAEFLLCGASNLVELNKEFRLTGCPKNTNAYIIVGDWGYPWTIYGKDGGNGSNFKITSISTDKRVLISVSKGATIDNIVFKPMITANLNATYDDFVPYTGDGDTLTEDVAKLKNDLGGLSFSVSGTTLSITDGTNTWTLSK